MKYVFIFPRRQYLTFHANWVLIWDNLHENVKLCFAVKYLLILTRGSWGSACSINSLQQIAQINLTTYLTHSDNMEENTLQHDYEHSFFSFIIKHKKSSESILNLDNNSWLDSVYITGNSGLRSNFSRHVFIPAQAYWYTSILIPLDCILRL